MNKEISDSLHFLLHCSLNDARFETQREQFEFIYKYIENLVKENQELKKQLEYLRSREYYNQLRFERDMLQYVADNGKVSQEDKEFIDMTHRNTELLEVIEEVKRVLKCNNIEVLKYYDEPNETGSYEIVTVDLLQILDKAKERINNTVRKAKVEE